MYQFPKRSFPGSRHRKTKGRHIRGGPYQFTRRKSFEKKLFIQKARPPLEGEIHQQIRRDIYRREKEKKNYLKCSHLFKYTSYFIPDE